MPETTPDRFATLSAPAHWQAVDFISDLHLQAAEPATLALWQHYLQQPPAQRADALFILGDLFEVWIGDDVLAPQAQDTTPSFWRTCAQLLREHSRHTPVYFMHGNRDFLLGASALGACGMQGLFDPTVLAFQGERWLLSHGDALCLADTDYQQFRAVVRSADWQRDFLAKPLSEREAIARGLREQSEARKRGSAHDPSLWADVDAGSAREWLQAAGSQTLIHGHTHRPDQHDLGQGLRRVVLSDWDATALPPRAEVLRLSAQDGLQRLPLC
ncbi:MAG TPA: UDP-2,3-diacylglucosamine diphosphatase [Hydrogenophaga sp.]|uniref:UDP-2,3-diacylglucosamine diphosphatase n=1 Tax=Hydrogenophaga sp. TaxID=1904254 RepID=UPI0008BF800C|nr:UDP-2,3-diacylglucosamine diphosphatase [Hydrogenophaga sp.]OGA78816.1 MAG: UDP-2,3-diacylglucosamine diphosphatase [Burkholderiales bacterium GWE1_65_30]OGA89387.1 MAG: UDP-2,3-diacylglucosamine diphosphatase [Burkholderiales bacterium GWF1_66_17]HAX23107.1 UDP-2,3-diacylglucosamine diphosphatase [Hydrogenophaga sp.]HBU17028.1 UDP-2,3-diacylglucosamine diphosphatase [Hydrogenophaga sp.]